ncbi:MAG: 4Fe-4S ferredoxin [Deltaproteobacteria bacterium HGW-Deltaproteobacteria-3]|jgi:polyferredoxin|nr:MAG: 4Fe-4S ferredoxin [Deltaproteobacteria bacterium HGW-Deltaproteobacteria-3]
MAMNPAQKQPAAQPRIDFHKLRLLVQSGFLLICLYSGYRFYQFYLWAMGSSATFVERPPAVEGFLPISGLVSLKRFLLTGSYDRIHPAALTIFIAALLIAIFFRKGFCGWICPVGFVSHLVERVARRLKILWRPPNWLDYPLLSFKYLLLAFFSWIILVAMDLAAIEAFMNTPYNLVVDARMLLFFIAPSATTIWVVSILVIGSFFLRNFWCRYFCPYGALMGVLSWFGPLRINRDEHSCINCKKCEKVCPGSIRVAEQTVVTSPECLGCLECVATCPVNNCLGVSTYRRVRVPAWLLPLGVLAIFFLAWAVANLTGHWQSAVPPEILKSYYPMSVNIGHP